MQILLGTYNPWLVILSWLITCFAVYTAFDLFCRVGSAQDREQRRWLLFGALVMGAGLWAMFFISLVSIHLPLPVRYDWGLAFFTLLIGAGASYLAFFAVSRGEKRRFRIMGAFIMGGGLAVMHAVSLAALIVPARIYYRVDLILILSVLGGGMGYYLTVQLICHARHFSPFLRKIGGSMFLSLLATGIHYSAMMNTQFSPNVFGHMGLAFSDWHTHSLFGLIAVITALLLAAVIGFSQFDKFVAVRAHMVTELRYHSLFQNNPDAVYTLDTEGRVINVNPPGCQLVGYTESELLHQSTLSLVDPDDVEKARFHYLKTTRGEGQEYEIHCVHKEGHLLNVLVKSIPMTFAGRMIGIYAIAKDITEEKRKEEALRKSEQQYRLIADHSSDLIKVITIDGIVTYASPSHEKYLGQLSETLLDQSIYMGVHPDDQEVLCAEISTMRTSKLPCTVELRRVHHSGEWIWMEAKGTPVLDDEGEMTQIVFTERDIRERHAYEERLRHMAYYDTLTDIPNRRLLRDRFLHAIADAKRSGAEIAVMYLDCDRFKMINDHLGHELGDEVLKEMVKRIKGCIRDTDTLARLGGDEFIVLMPVTDSGDSVKEIAERICKACNQPLVHGDNEIDLAVSIGIAMYPQDGKDQKTLLKQADEALYEAKRRGRNTFQFWFESVGEAAASMSK